MEKVVRRAEVEMALVRAGGEVNKSALARELGVTRRTIQRDVKAVRERWQLLAVRAGDGMVFERAGTAAALAGIAEEALGQYRRLAGEDGRESSAVGYLRTALKALEQRSKLMGLGELPPEGVFGEAGEVRYTFNVVYADEEKRRRRANRWQEGADGALGER